MMVIGEQKGTAHADVTVKRQINDQMDIWRGARMSEKRAV